jgi:hypothetical protein
MSVVTATAAVPATGPERRWRRRSLVALVLLLPAALAEMSWTSVIALLSNEDLVARDVAWGSSARFGGSDWRLADLKGGKGLAGLPANAVAVEADFTVTVGSADLQNLWSRCKLMLVDAESRLWLPAALPGVRLPDGAMSCNSAIFSGAKPGDVLKISETFTVPEDATKVVRPAVGLGSERPYYLRFDRPPG